MLLLIEPCNLPRYNTWSQWLYRFGDLSVEKAWGPCIMNWSWMHCMFLELQLFVIYGIAVSCHNPSRASEYLIRYTPTPSPPSNRLQWGVHHWHYGIYQIEPTTFSVLLLSLYSFKNKYNDHSWSMLLYKTGGNRSVSHVLHNESTQLSMHKKDST